MKILTIAIPNHHFFQWVNHLEDSGYVVFWFDITDGGPPSPKIPWVTQVKGWKLRWDFPMRSGLKARFPKVYKAIQRFNENEVEIAFAKAYQTIQPDIVHCFEMQLSGLPILHTLERLQIPLIYSSWGSDLFDFKRLGVSQKQATAFLQRADYLITDCKRDQAIAVANGFNGESLGVYPGNGGLDIVTSAIQNSPKRKTILIKGYDDGIGQAAVVLEAFTLIDPSLLDNKHIVVYSADRSIEQQIKASETLSALGIQIYSRHSFVENKTLLKLMGESILHIANSLSDGMPNALLEAMGMGAFPLQSNPGGATEEVITDGLNGFLINDPLDAQKIASLIEKALGSDTVREAAQKYNTDFISKNYNRSTLRPEIIGLYQQVYSNLSS